MGLKESNDNFKNTFYENYDDFIEQNKEDIEFFTNKFNLNKLRKLSRAKHVEIPEEILEISNLEMPSLEKFKKSNTIVLDDAIRDFAQYVKDNFSLKTYLLLQEKLNKISILPKPSKLMNCIGFDGKDCLGCYSSITNTIILYENKISKKNSVYHTLHHELLHLLSTPKLYNPFSKASGLRVISGHFRDMQIFALGLNEGVTEYITEKNLYGKLTENKSYYYLKHVASILGIIMGESLNTCYVESNLYKFISILKKYAPEEKVYEFILALDTMHNYICYEESPYTTDEMINITHTIIFKFLINVYHEKNLKTIFVTRRNRRVLNNISESDKRFFNYVISNFIVPVEDFYNLRLDINYLDIYDHEFYNPKGPSKSDGEQKLRSHKI